MEDKLITWDYTDNFKYKVDAFEAVCLDDGTVLIMGGWVDDERKHSQGYSTEECWIFNNINDIGKKWKQADE
jgi:hypothetical protein